MRRNERKTKEGEKRETRKVVVALELKNKMLFKKRTQSTEDFCSCVVDLLQTYGCSDARSKYKTQG